jgi:hypothetical protein
MSNVNHPAHYNQGKIEVIEFIEDKNLGFHRGNAVKYIARAGIKDPDKEIEDLEKARWYLDREIELAKSRRMGMDPRRPNDMNPRDCGLICQACRTRFPTGALAAGDQCTQCHDGRVVRAPC